MPVLARGCRVIEKADGKVLKDYSVKGKCTAAGKRKAKKYATARNMGHARSKGYDVPPPKKKS